MNQNSSAPKSSVPLGVRWTIAWMNSLSIRIADLRIRRALETMYACPTKLSGRNTTVIDVSKGWPLERVALCLPQRATRTSSQPNGESVTKGRTDDGTR